MTAAIPAALLAHLKQDTITLASCFRLTCRTGQVFRWTTHQEALTVAGETYAPGIITQTFASEYSISLSADNLEIEFVLAAAGILPEQLEAGLLDGAAAFGHLVDYTNPSGGGLAQRSGTVGEVKFGGETDLASFELLGLTDKLNSSITESYTQTCRAQFGDKRCKRVPLTVAGVVESVESLVIHDSRLTQPTDTFAFGKVTFTSGANTGLIAQVTASLAGQLTLDVPPPYPIAVGDSYTAEEGCPRLINVCRERFANVINFRGEPYLPDPNRVTLPTIGR